MKNNRKTERRIFIDSCDNCPIKRDEQKQGIKKGEGECCQRLEEVTKLRDNGCSIDAFSECIDTFIESGQHCAECFVMLAFLCAEAAYDTFDQIVKNKDNRILDLLSLNYGNSCPFSAAVLKLFFGENVEGIKRIKELAADGDKAAEKLLIYLK